LTKTEAPSFSELAPYYSNIENATKSLEEARRRLEDAVLRSPIDGKIVKID
jgi:multidrug resistance efflux pump